MSGTLEDFECPHEGSCLTTLPNHWMKTVKEYLTQVGMAGRRHSSGSNGDWCVGKEVADQ